VQCTAAQRARADANVVKRAGGWREAESGYLRHNYWVPARAGKAKRIATWRPTLTAPGDYQVVVKIPSANATTRRAVYRIKTIDGWVEREVDQSASQGKWVDVGIFTLTTTPAVKLTDRTGERASLGRRVGFDAIRFVPAGQPRVSSDLASPVDQAPVDPQQLMPQAGSEAPTVEPVAEPTPPRDASGDATPKPTPEREPAAEQTPEPTPDRAKEPTAEPTKELAWEPDPTPTATPEPTKDPGPTPEPTPEPTVTTAREPDPPPERTPEPTPEQTPEPISQPAGEPSAEPDASPAAG
jgi:hypothetical protein